ncbi:hypothetical protein NIES2107_64730 [Nostoc carneum NIES-2107]|nr:hypothetical protein NIES2107_64730 [Nostoc carneum NIES-2107]
MGRGSGGSRGSKGSEEVIINNSLSPPAPPASPAHYVGNADSLLEAYKVVAQLLQLQTETVATVAQIQLLQEILKSQRNLTVMDILSTSLFTTSVLGALGGSGYLLGSVIATGVLSAGLLPALGIVVGAGFAILGRVSK